MSHYVIKCKFILNMYTTVEDTSYSNDFCLLESPVNGIKT